MITKINNTDLFGVLHLDANRFDDEKYFTKENAFNYRLSKIRFFLGNNEGKESILGLQTFYKNKEGIEIASEKAKDEKEKELDIKAIEIPPNDYICNFYLRAGDENITQIELVTYKGKKLIIGSKEGEDKYLEIINDNKDNIILSFFGAYRKSLEAIGLKFINIKDYLGNSRGFFELKIKLKKKAFRNAIKGKIDSLSKSDKVLFRVCNLPENCFNSIIKYCLFN